MLQLIVGSSCRNAFNSDRHGSSIALAPWFRTARATSVPQVGAFAFRSFQARQLSLKESFLKALRDNPAVSRLKCVDSTASSLVSGPKGRTRTKQRWQQHLLRERSLLLVVLRLHQRACKLPASQLYCLGPELTAQTAALSAGCAGVLTETRMLCGLISGQLAVGANRQHFPRFPPTSPDSLLLALMALFFDNLPGKLRKPKLILLPGWT